MGARVEQVYKTHRFQWIAVNQTFKSWDSGRWLKWSKNENVRSEDNEEINENLCHESENDSNYDVDLEVDSYD